MPKEIYLVKVGMTMTEGMVSEWYVSDGASVKTGEMIYALETEKVNLDVDAETDGIVKHLVEAGVMLEPGDVVGYLFEAGETIPDDLGQHSPARADTTVTEQKQQPPSMPPMSAAASAAGSATGGRIKASPAARRLAGELGVDYTRLSGTGPGGRILEADVMAAGASTGASTEVSTGDIKASPLARRLAAAKGIDLARVTGTGPGGRIVQADIDSAAGRARDTGAVGGSQAAVKRVPVKGMRRTIASRMHHSLQTSAQLTMDMEVLMDDAIKLRYALIDEWQGESLRPTYTDLVVKAAAKALRLHPMMNSQFIDDDILLLDEVNIGIAVALPEGLVVPVLRHADQLPVKQLVAETSRLATAARDGALGLDDYAGGTFTVSALGMYGVDSFTPIINEPQSGILGVNRIFDGVEWDGDRPVKTGKMNLSLTWDHRAVDGAPAAEFLAAVRDLLQAPYRLLV